MDGRDYRLNGRKAKEYIEVHAAVPRDDDGAVLYIYDVLLGLVGVKNTPKQRLRLSAVSFLATRGASLKEVAVLSMVPSSALFCHMLA